MQMDKASMHPARIQRVFEKPLQPGPVVYWMHREMRAADNWALIHAAQLAREQGRALCVAFCLARHYSMASLPHFAFLVRGLRTLAASLERLGIPLALVRGEPGRVIPELLRHLGAGLAVTDADPTRLKRQWLGEVAARADIPVVVVDGRNVVPAHVVSDKREHMARTIRPKIQRLLPEFLESFPEPAAPGGQALAAPLPPVDWDALEREFGPAPALFEPGEQAARKRLEAFLSSGLPRYAGDRNTPVEPACSLLSPYLHFGQISAARAALEVLARGSAPQEARDAFLEQLIVRRELAENFCLYTPNYDSVDCFPAWALQTLEKHRGDPRQLVNDDQLDAADTPDPLWNAAQRQLLATGHMHGWLRMYWAKQVLLWSPDAATALSRVLRMNDSLSLDGRDVNGYAGAAWSIGGVHDRPWPERAVFGVVRSMTLAGAGRKFDVAGFIGKWGSAPAQGRLL